MDIFHTDLNGQWPVASGQWSVVSKEISGDYWSSIMASISIPLMPNKQCQSSESN